MRLNPEDKKIVNELENRLKKYCNVLELKIYGSRARGDFDFESDLDVFIVVEKVDPKIRRKISEIAWEIGFSMDRVISTFVATPSQLKNSMLAANPIIDQIERDGISI